MSIAETPEEARQRRQDRLTKIAEYLEDEFPGHKIEPQMPDPVSQGGSIRVIRENQVIHQANIRRDFLDDDHDHVAALKRWGFTRCLKEAAARPLWVGTEGLS